MKIATAGSIWLVCPVYHDVESFLILRRELLHVLARDHRLSNLQARFVVVDDTGGLDPEMRCLDEMADVTVVEPPFNLGHQRAIVYGLRTVACQMEEDDIVVTLDSDGEDRPDDLTRLVDPLFERPQERGAIALALRTERHEPALFKAMYLCFRLAFRLLTGLAIRTGNYAAYRGWTAKRLLRHPHFDLCYSSSFISLNLAVEYVPCPRGRRYAGRSRMSYSRLILHGMRMLMPFTDRLALRALLIFSMTFGLGVVLALGFISVRVVTSMAIPGWVPAAVGLLLTLSFVALGNFILLFALFAQSRSISLAGIEYEQNGSARRPPPASD